MFSLDFCQWNNGSVLCCYWFPFSVLIRPDHLSVLSSGTLGLGPLCPRGRGLDWCAHFTVAFISVFIHVTSGHCGTRTSSLTSFLLWNFAQRQTSPLFKYGCCFSSSPLREFVTFYLANVQYCLDFQALVNLLTTIFNHWLMWRLDEDGSQQLNNWTTTVSDTERCCCIYFWTSGSVPCLSLQSILRSLSAIFRRKKKQSSRAGSVPPSCGGKVKLSTFLHHQTFLLPDDWGE